MLLTKAKALVLPTAGTSLVMGSVLGAACASCAWGGLVAPFYRRAHDLQWMTEKKQCMFLALLSDELHRPGAVVAEKPLVNCRDWTRSSVQL